MQLETPGVNQTQNSLKTTTAVIWKMMYRIKDWFIHLLILSTVYEQDKQNTIVY